MKTKNFKFKSMALVLFALVLSSNAWGAEVTIASWSGASRTANQNYSPTSSQTDNSSARLMSECGLTTAGTGGSSGAYYGDWTNGKCIYITGLDLSCYTGISVTANLRRRNATCTAAFYTSTDGSSYSKTALDTKTLTNSSTDYTVTGIGSSVQAIKIVITGGSGNLWLGDVSLSGTAAASKTLSSIAVKTPPTKVTYTEGDKFDPTGLVITKTYSDASTEDLAYAGHTSDFTFSPTTSAALTTSNTSVTITVGGKSTTQSITVNAKSKYTVTFYNAGEVVKTVSDVTEGTLFSAIKPTIGTGSGQLNIESCDNSSTHFMGWTAEESFQKRETAPSYVADNDAINDNMTVRAVWAKEDEE